ncbi:MAG: glycosyltransferase family 4 protein [Betaproteobacteria bacterium]
MRIAYLVNQYPMVSLTFIRREIHALEAQGVAVQRFAMRAWKDRLVDPADLAELAKTRCIQSVGLTGLLAALFMTFVARPVRFAQMLALVLRILPASDRGPALHLAYLAQACVLLRWLDKERIEHLHAHFASNSAEVAMFCAGLGGPPYSFTVHGPEEFDRAVGLGYREKVGRAKFVAAISEYCRSQLFRWSAHADWEKIRIVHCGLDETLLKAAPTPVPGAPRLVCVGRLCEEKGHLVLVEAAAELAGAGVAFELVLVGDGPIRPQLEALIARRGLADRIRITGWAQASEVRSTLQQSRALVLPSFAEGLPVVIMEALALGRPVISTYVAAIPELVRHGENGWLVMPGNVRDLAAAMREVLAAPPAQLERMGAKGRADVLARHDVTVESARLMRYMAGAAGGESSQGIDLADKPA